MVGWAWTAVPRAPSCSSKSSWILRPSFGMARLECLNWSHLPTAPVSVWTPWWRQRSVGRPPSWEAATRRQLRRSGRRSAASATSALVEERVWSCWREKHFLEWWRCQTNRANFIAFSLALPPTLHTLLGLLPCFFPSWPSRHSTSPFL